MRAIIGLFASMGPPPGMADLADPELLTGPSDNGEVAARPFTEDHSMSDNPAKHGKYPRRATREAGLNAIIVHRFRGRWRAIPPLSRGTKIPGMGPPSN